MTDVTTEQLAAMLLEHPGAYVKVANGLGYATPQIVKLASTEYCMEPIGRKKIAIVPEGK